MPRDPFPRDRVNALIRRLPAYLRLAWRLAKDPLLSKARRAAVLGAAGYLASPIDLVPGVVPVIGQLDDLAVAIAALRLALAGLSPERRRVHLEAVGLRDQDLTDDLRTIGATIAWIGRAGLRTTRRVAATGTRVAAEGAGAAVRTTQAAAARAAPRARAVAERAAASLPGATVTLRRLTPAARTAADRATPAAKATGRIATDAGTKAKDASARARDAAAAAAGRIQWPGRSKGPAVRVREVELPLLPPPGPTTPRSDAG